MDVLCAEESSSAYLDHDADKNIFGSMYHVREPATRKLSMTIADFAGCLTSWTSKKLLLKVHFPFYKSSSWISMQPNSCPLMAHSAIRGLFYLYHMSPPLTECWLASTR